MHILSSFQSIQRVLQKHKCFEFRRRYRTDHVHNGQVNCHQILNVRYSLIHWASDKTVFEGAKAFGGSGGALYLSNVFKMTINNSTFTGAYAAEKGGAIFYDCTDSDRSCNLTFTGTNYFTKNKAAGSGGAIFWTENEPIYKDDEIL